MFIRGPSDIYDFQRNIKKLNKLASGKIRAAEYDQASSMYMANIYELIRVKSGLPLDGADLINKALGVKNARIVLDDMSDASGRNYQKGVIDDLLSLTKLYRNRISHGKNMEQPVISKRDAEYLRTRCNWITEKICVGESGVQVREDGVYYCLHENNMHVLYFFSEDSTTKAVYYHEINFSSLEGGGVDSQRLEDIKREITTRKLHLASNCSVENNIYSYEFHNGIWNVRAVTEVAQGIDGRIGCAFNRKDRDNSTPYIRGYDFDRMLEFNFYRC